METLELREAKIYVGTYAKYNEGSLFGEWLNLSDYSDKADFLEACNELHEDETDKELMFQDWENIPSSLVGESYISDKFWELLDAIDSMSNESAFLEFLDWQGYNLESEDINNITSQFEDSYSGEHEDLEAYAYELVDDCYNLDEFAKRYFDYRKFANDLECDGCYFSNGFVFRPF